VLKMVLEATPEYQRIGPETMLLFLLVIYDFLKH